MNIEGLLAQAEALYRLGDLEGAAKIYSQAVQPDTTNAAPYYMLGIIRAQLGRFDEAIQPLQRAISLMPGHPVVLASYANVLNAVGRQKEALANCEAALTTDSYSLEALIAQGAILCGLGRFEEALTSYDRALGIDPKNVMAWNNRAIAFHNLKRFEEALNACDRALAIDPLSAEGRSNRGNALHALRRFGEALEEYERALALSPKSNKIRINRGSTLIALNHFHEALGSFDNALASDPRSVDGLNGRGLALFHLGLPDEALKCFEAALEIDPGIVDAWNNKGKVLKGLGRLTEALSSYEKALAIDANDRSALEGIFATALSLCDWQRVALFGERLIAQARTGIPVSPFNLLTITDDNALQLMAAQNFASAQLPIVPNALCSKKGYGHEKLRVAYLSADFFEHPVAFQIVQLLELHDRSRFEIYGLSSGPDDQSDIRARIAGACDRFFDISGLDDAAVARLIRSHEIDILIDLNGYTEGSRFGVLSHRPCAVQIAWLGYSGTQGSPFVDYVIADKIILPVENQKYFSESALYLPDSFFPSDARRAISDGCSRHDMKLPSDAFVFCCFNASWKISSQQFDVWMRLLRAVPASVLWLRGQNIDVRSNLTSQASARGVDPERLIFADHVPLEVHLARHKLADLFLDTSPYNAHATASDALWAGLPVLTCKTGYFPGRVGASLLSALGLPELIAEDLHSYELIALELARDATRLASLRNRLWENRQKFPLFDTAKLCRNVEAIYLETAAQHQKKIGGR
jgi:protein O-GlcNAc transferase